MHSPMASSSVEARLTNRHRRVSDSGRVRGCLSGTHSTHRRAILTARGQLRTAHSCCWSGALLPCRLHL